MTAPARNTARMRSCRWQTKYYWTRQSRCVALHPCVARREKNLQRPNSIMRRVGAADAGARLKGRAMLIGAPRQDTMHVIQLTLMSRKHYRYCRRQCTRSPLIYEGVLHTWQSVHA